MKKLNVTKERFEKSRYFTNKYGKLEYVSESGKLFKTDKGNVLKFKESTKKQPKKVVAVKESASDIARDPAYQCPYCGSHDCWFDDAEFSPHEGYFDGATLNAQFFCNKCNKPYNVQFELKVKDVYPNEDADELGYDE